ncbi:hypothetical protein D3C86_2152460 [compost metagenome]
MAPDSGNSTFISSRARLRRSGVSSSVGMPESTLFTTLQIALRALTGSIMRASRRINAILMKRGMAHASAIEMTDTS